MRLATDCFRRTRTGTPDPLLSFASSNSMPESSLPSVSQKSRSKTWQTPAMVSNEQIVSAVVGGFALVYGVQTLLTKKAAFSSDDRETDLWIYGWRAVLIALFALLISALCFASAFGLLQLSWEWHG